MALTEYQKAFIHNYLILKEQVVDSATGSPVDWSALGGSTVTGTSDVPGLDAALAGKQPLDSDLTAIAALSTTSFGRGLLALADAAALAANHTHSSSSVPLDSYSLHGTYGDDFTAASLDAKWTRRNFTSGAETYQVGKNGTYLRISGAGRGIGDGYLQPITADGTYALKLTMRNWGSATLGYGIALVDSAGTGVVASVYNNPLGILLQTLTTYTTYGGSFKGVGGDTNPIFQSLSTFESVPLWLAIRKSGTSCFASMSLDGEMWSTESGAITWSGTMNRGGMLISPLGAANGSAATAIVDWDWFNKIA